MQRRSEMKIKKSLTVMAMSALFVIGTVGTAFAETEPHSMLGTERKYGETSTRYGELLNWEDGVNGRYAIVPKNDTFSFEKGDSNVDPSHDVVISWECPNSFDENGQVGLFWESNMSAKTEKLEFGKDYPVYPDEVKSKVAELKATGYYNMTHVEDPFIIIKLTDNTMNFSWHWILHVTDNWVVPTTIAEDTQHWVYNENGWWIENPDGSFLVNAWYKSPESGLWYYMGSDGYMLVNTITPDGYKVGEDGAWVR